MPESAKKPNVWRTMGNKWKATVYCSDPSCTWGVTMSGESEFEVLQFLVARLNEHMMNLHGVKA